MSQMQLLSIQVGQPRTYGANALGSNEWTSAISKSPVDGPVRVDVLGVEGDVQVDRKHHGGPYQAVCVYPSENYDRWRTLPGLEQIGGGGFGENFTTRGLLESTVYVGDVYRVGEVIAVVTQPRAPCGKLSRLWQVKDLTLLAEEEGRTGFYLKVRQPGPVQAGDPIELLERPFPQWSIARVWTLKRHPIDRAAVLELAACPALSPEWQGYLRRSVDA